MTRRLDHDFKQLKAANKALHRTSSVRMREAALRFLWDKWVFHAATAPAPPQMETKAKRRKKR